MKPPTLVRTLTAAERQQVQAGLRAADAFTVRRCQILLASAHGQRAPASARNLGCAVATVHNALRALAHERLGSLDETWWSRLKQPALHAWTADDPVRLLQREADQADPDPKALACDGLLRDDTEQMLLRFVPGRPVSQVTEDFRAWVCARLHV